MLRITTPFARYTWHHVRGLRGWWEATCRVCERQGMTTRFAGPYRHVVRGLRGHCNAIHGGGAR